MSKKQNSRNISVEAAHYILLNKYYAAIDEVMAATLKVDDRGLAAILNELNALKTEYELETVEYIGDYYDNVAGASDNYFAAVLGGSYSSRLNGLIKRAQICVSALVSKKRIVKKDIETLLAMDPNDDIITVEYEEINDDICKVCNSKMIPVAETSIYKCDCGAVFEIIGMAFNKSQIYRTDGAKIKTPRVPTVEDRHFKVWMERIQAIENKNIPQEHLNKIRACFMRDNIRPKTDLTYSLMRSYLQELRLTCYNEHTALLLKIFTEVSPYVLTMHEYKEISLKFIMVLEIYKETEWRNKKPYYPYFIYKIIDCLYPSESDPPRKLLSYIHLQKEDTLKKKDIMFAEICKIGQGRGLGLKAKPTFVGK